MLIFFFYFFVTVLILFILMAFFIGGKKENWEFGLGSAFECGFTSYFFSRYSFSMHFFLLGLIFLFLDLELCFVMPFFVEDFPSMTSLSESGFFITILILGVLYEWNKNLLDWKF